MFYVYLLESTNNATYIGATMNLERRIRQHNKEIKGGATATGIRVSRGEIWKRVCYVQGFPNWNAALQFEWRWKQISRKQSVKKPMEKRMLALDHLLSLAKSTEKAISFNEWEKKPEVIFDIPANISTLLSFPDKETN